MVVEVIASRIHDVFDTQCSYNSQASNDKSHTRTIVRKYCKDDDRSQWGRAKFDPLQPAFNFVSTTLGGATTE